MTRNDRRRMFGSAVVTLMAMPVILLAPNAAIADPASDGFWYFDDFHIQEAHDAGLTGEGVTIAVLDSPINLDVPTLKGADIEVQDSICHSQSGEATSATSTDLAVADHGTNVVSYLVGSGEGYPGQTGIRGLVPEAKVIFTAVGAPGADGVIQCFLSDGTTQADPLEQGILAAIDAKADIISVSVGGAATFEATQALTQALALGIVVVAALPNTDEFSNIGLDFIARSNGVVGVQSIDTNVRVQGDHTDPLTDVTGPGVDVVWQGDGDWAVQRYARGTSIATPIVAGMLGLAAQKYPDATGNQLIQSLIRNTGADDHALEYDTTGHFGYGLASATHMLRVDPSQYDDVNPLISDDPGESPTADEIAAAVDALTTGEDPPGGAPAAEANGVDIPWVPILTGGGVLLLVIVAVIIGVAVAARRRSTRARPPRTNDTTPVQ